MRALPYGGIDDATRDFELPIAVRAAVTPALAALRWGALAYGLVFGAPEAVRGNYAPVVTLAVCLFVTTWRTVLPLRLASTQFPDRAAALADVAILGLAVGYGGGLDSPFIFCLLAAVVAVAFGWGAVPGGAAIAVAAAAAATGVVLGTTSLPDQAQDQRDLALLAAFLLAVAGATYVRHRLLLDEARSSALDEKIRSLTDANDLLNLLTLTARAMPSSMTQREVIATTRQQLTDNFDARVIALVVRSDSHDEWTPNLAAGCQMAAVSTQDQLPEPLRAALRSAQPVLRADLTHGEQGIVPGMGSGLYVRLTARGETIGVVGLEHPTINKYGARDVSMVDGLAEILGLTLDNARWFSRLRRLGAEEERTRIARDLHDRLGQWLTYIGIEIERISRHPDDMDEELDRLRSDVSSALDELRETLRQLRTNVTDDRPLAAVAHTTLERFSERTGIATTCAVDNPEARLAPPIENELLRILQESLNNVERHASADAVHVQWTIETDTFSMVVRDNGDGFDTSRSARESAYGLVGMRERADAIGARLEIQSTPGEGTTITVVAGTDRTKEATP